MDPGSNTNDGKGAKDEIDPDQSRPNEKKRSTRSSNGKTRASNADKKESIRDDSEGEAEGTEEEAEGTEEEAEGTEGEAEGTKGKADDTEAEADGNGHPTATVDVPAEKTPPKRPIEQLNPAQKLAELKVKAPKVVAKRLKKIRDWEKQNPNRKMHDDYIQEYLLQDYETDETEIELPPGGFVTSEEVMQFVESLIAKKAEFRTAQSINQAFAWKQQDEPLEEVLPTHLPPQSDEPSLPPSSKKTTQAKKSNDKSTKAQKKVTPTFTSKSKDSKSTPNDDYEKKRAEALKRLKQLEKERIEIGPDPEMMKQNKDLERAVVEQALAKQVLMEAATKKKAQETEKRDGRLKKSSIDDSTAQTAQSENIFENLTLEQMEAAIKREEDLRAAAESKKPTKQDPGDEKRSKPKKKFDDDLFRKVREKEDAKNKDNKTASKNRLETDTNDDSFDFSSFEQEPPLIEYQDFCYGNVRFLNLGGIKPLEDLKDDEHYNDMFGMVSNKAWVRLHFGDPESRDPPPEPKPSKKKKPKPNVDQVELTPEFTEKMKEKKVDLDKKKVVSHIPRDFMFRRPPRKIMYVELPLTKTNYGGNWQTIEKDTKKRIKHKKRLPEYIQTKDNPHQALDMVVQRAELNTLRGQANKWTKGKVKPAGEDYFDWMVGGKMPKERMNNSPEEKKPDGKSWFRSPPKYKPESPNDSLFDEYDFCGYGNRAKAYFLDVTLPREAILYNSRFKKSDEIFNATIPKPVGSFPGYALPRWLTWPLDKKLPQHHSIPKETFFWTRGRIGQSLYQSIPKIEFRLDDPLNQNKVDYDSLHDEKCKRYFVTEPAKDTITKSKLIDKEGNVFCTQAQQNQYRMYLKDAAYRAQCNKALQRKYDRKTRELAGHKYLVQREKGWPMVRALHQDALDVGKSMAQDRRMVLIQRQEKLEKERDERMRSFRETQRLKLEDKRNRKNELYPRPSFAIQQNVKDELNEEKNLLYQLNQEIAEHNKLTVAVNKQMEADEKKRISWEKRVKEMDRQKTLMNWAIKVTRDNRRRQMAKREERNALHRKRLPEIMAKRKLEKQRLNQIVRKYFWRWVSKVRKHRKENEESSHMSYKSVDLNETIDYLYQQTGIKKLDQAALLGKILVDNMQAVLKAARAQREDQVKQKQPDVVVLMAPEVFTLSKNPIQRSDSSLTNDRSTLGNISQIYESVHSEFPHGNYSLQSKSLDESAAPVPINDISSDKLTTTVSFPTTVAMSQENQEGEEDEEEEEEEEVDLTFGNDSEYEASAYDGDKED